MSMKPLVLCFAGLLLVSLFNAPAGAQYVFPDVKITGSSVTSISVRPLDRTWEYRYRVTNPDASDTGIEGVAIDVSAPVSLPAELLPMRGFFWFDAVTKFRHGIASHVPVGADIPDAWVGFISNEGAIHWSGPAEGVKASDPILPGSSRDDFLLRSNYLPGVRRFHLLPDYPFTCCSWDAADPRNEEITFKEAKDFQVEGFTIAPTYEPKTVSLELLRSLASQVCELAWISHPGICQSLGVKIEQASRSMQQGRVQAAKGQLQSLLRELEAQYGSTSGKHVNENAYWLLRAHVQHLLARL